MTTHTFASRSALAAGALATATLALASLGGAPAGADSSHAPRAATGSVGHVRGTSAVLQGTVNPRGEETSYYFRYGPTPAYGQQTATASAGKGTSTVKVGQTVANLPVGDHYQLVASSHGGTAYGRDRVYSGAHAGRLKFAIASTKEQPPTPYGGTFVLRGTLSGSGAALHSIGLEQSPFPFTSAFVALGAPLLTNSAGAFAIPIPHLTASTQVRVHTNDPRPVLGPVVTVHVGVRVTLKVRTSSRRGLVRLYGTVTPAQVGAHVLFQLEKAARPRGRSEREVRYVTQGTGVVKRATRAFSRFSEVLTIRKGGRYRAYVLVRSGALVSGASPAVTLHAAPETRGRKKR